jgi:hypothetical protein
MIEGSLRGSGGTMQGLKIFFHAHEIFLRLRRVDLAKIPESLGGYNFLRPPKVSKKCPKIMDINKKVKKSTCKWHF